MTALPFETLVDVAPSEVAPTRVASEQVEEAAVPLRLLVLDGWNYG